MQGLFQRKIQRSQIEKMTMNFSLTYAGVFVMVAGTFLVQQLGLSEACATEFSEKIVNYAPLAIGALTALFGRWKAGGVNWYGGKA